MSTLRPTRRRLAALAVVTAAALSMTGCSQVVEAFNSISGQQNAAAATPAPNATPATGEVEMPFDSQFTYDGSVQMTYEIADGLQIILDFWAVDSKRTREWYPDAAKTFGFAVNVKDTRVDEKAVLKQKRRVFLSNVSISSQTAQSSNQVSSPFQFSADPRTLVPTDTIRSSKGLLINSYQGGLLVPETTINQLPQDTYGITLQFALDIWVEGTANDAKSFAQQTVYPVIPIAIYPRETETEGSTGGATDGSSSDDGSQGTTGTDGWTTTPGTGGPTTP
ncbi:fructose 1,6-bisphosphatase [Microbacterium sp. EYE_5]|uniref:fructose 1,6-bisphosphatase n=1 Tax=unclassified Microbacterium TaxID=2609290 RepID=UPI0020063269|nr:MULTISPECIES: fructose 1,6-bisphosphatase [unclassified Microbacterium]MCK6079068.1 fructose 1,6-bisphosphatase [Microbacterium sp. EYE_382]MCK6084338.1 fructose 1,6-bisphosphatase [Microbacterium sp. EYE_384]MCK6123433.1 fructose 1,6-bisphosphatase [Microbacterium sp. EYE_80]MCK6125102.1 fructose 1,6-bisphosphatase [Microbacterium sp. EYE_79]MCK6140022.1 fructose 1,6-bisphosphatase [Microbacterium sp. EYE_39]